MSGFGHICFRIKIQDQTNKLKLKFNLSQFSDANPISMEP